MSTGTASLPQAPRPMNLVAELTYRCPLRCSYCSNPLAYRDVHDGLDAGAWSRVFREAAALGVVHVGLTGGEPSTRADLAQIVAAAAEAGLYTHLVTAGMPLKEAGLAALCEAGLRSVQLSFQDSEAEPSDAVAGVTAFETKLAFAGWVRARSLALSLNFVLHRHNLPRISEMIELACRLDADRVELANTQYHGWAWLNREALLPRREQIEEAARAVARARAAGNRPEIVFVLPDYFSDRPKPCMGGWGRRTLVVAPDGRVLPCHAARSIPGLEFWSANDRSLEACWTEAPGMQAFRGESWMPEPCRSCDLRAVDFGGCRCQAYAITGDAAATDPACALAPQHDHVVAARLRTASGNPRPTARHRGEAIGPDGGERTPAGA